MSEFLSLSQTQMTLVVVAGLASFSAASRSADAGQHCVICNGPSATYLCEAQNGPGLLSANGGQLACITELAKRGGHDSCSVIRQAAAQCDGLTPTVLFPGTGDAQFNNAIKNEEPVTTPPGADTTDNRPVPPPTATTTTLPDQKPNPATQPSPDAGGPAPEPFTPVDDQNQPQPHPPGEQAEEKPKPQQPPKTVVEMADRAYESTKEGLGKTGEAVGDTAKSAGEIVTDTAKKTGKAVGNAAKKTWDCVTSLFSKC